MIYSSRFTFKTKEGNSCCAWRAAILARRISAPRATRLYQGAILSLTLIAALGALARPNASNAPAGVLPRRRRTPVTMQATPPRRRPMSGRHRAAARCCGCAVWCPRKRTAARCSAWSRPTSPILRSRIACKIAEGGPPREQWLGAVSFGLKQLSHLKQGSTQLLGRRPQGLRRSAQRPRLCRGEEGAVRADADRPARFERPCSPAARRSLRIRRHARAKRARPDRQRPAARRAARI